MHNNVALHSAHYCEKRPQHGDYGTWQPSTVTTGAPAKQTLEELAEKVLRQIGDPIFGVVSVGWHDETRAVILSALRAVEAQKDAEIERLKARIETTRQPMWAAHNPDCDALDTNPDGIRKPCNCGNAEKEGK